MSIIQDELEKNLVCNIGLMARRLLEAGYRSSDIDALCDEALAFIQNKAEQITADNPIQSQNVENIIIMVLMHGALTSQKKFINDTAKSLKTNIIAIENEMIKDTISKRRS